MGKELCLRKVGTYKTVVCMYVSGFKCIGTVNIIIIELPLLCTFLWFCLIVFFNILRLYFNADVSNSSCVHKLHVPECIPILL